MNSNEIQTDYLTGASTNAIARDELTGQIIESDYIRPAEWMLNVPYSKIYTTPQEAAADLSSYPGYENANVVDLTPNRVPPHWLAIVEDRRNPGNYYQKSVRATCNIGYKAFGVDCINENYNPVYGISNQTEVLQGTEGPDIFFLYKRGGSDIITEYTKGEDIVVLYDSGETYENVRPGRSSQYPRAVLSSDGYSYGSIALKEFDFNFSPDVITYQPADIFD